MLRDRGVPLPTSIIRSVVALVNECMADPPPLTVEPVPMSARGDRIVAVLDVAVDAPAVAGLDELDQ